MQFMQKKKSAKAHQKPLMNQEKERERPDLLVWVNKRAAGCEPRVAH